MANQIAEKLKATLSAIDSRYRSVAHQGCAVDVGVFTQRRHVAKVEALREVHAALRMYRQDQTVIQLCHELTALVEQSIEIMRLNDPSLYDRGRRN